MKSIEQIQKDLNHMTKRVEWYHKPTSIAVYSDCDNFIAQTLIKVAQTKMRQYTFNSVEIDSKGKIFLLFIQKKE